MRCPCCGIPVEDPGRHRCTSCGARIGGPRSVLRTVERLEDAVLVVLLSAMVLLVLLQIIMRDVFSTGLTGGAEATRHMVLWLAFISAGVTAREGKHIRIDIAQRVLPTGIRPIAEILTSLFTVGVCAALLYASVGFMRVDYETGSRIVFQAFQVPVWALEAVIPIGYCMILFRYALRCVYLARMLAGKDRPT